MESNTIMAIEVMSPVGRLVQGDAFTANQRKDDDGKLVFNEDGTPAMQYYEAVAIEKNNPEWPAFYAQIVAEARQGYPQYFDPATGQCRIPGFSFKITDGDGVDMYGKPNDQKEGFKGCWVLKFTTQIAPKVIHKGQYLQDKNAIKRGYFVRVFCSIKANIGSKKPGVYMNQLCTELIGYGQEIQGGADYTDKFATAAAYVPQGMTNTPPAPLAMPPGTLPTPPGAMAAPALPVPPGAAAALPTPPAAALPLPSVAAPLPPAMAAPPYEVTPAAQGHTIDSLKAHGMTIEQMVAQGFVRLVPPAPNHAFVANAMPTFTMTPAAQGFTREQYLAQGYTDEMLIAQGFMTKQ